MRKMVEKLEFIAKKQSKYVVSKIITDNRFVPHRRPIEMRSV